MELEDIPALLKQRGISQTQLAAQVGVSQAHLSQMIRGVRRMPLDVFRKVEASLAPLSLEVGASGVRETRIPFLTLEDARRLKDVPPPKVTDEERARLLRELKELAEALKALPRITDMSDDEILGYDEMEP